MGSGKNFFKPRQQELPRKPFHKGTPIYIDLITTSHSSPTQGNAFIFTSFQSTQRKHLKRNTNSVLCAVCGRVVRQSLLSNCRGAPTLGRQLALRDVLLGFLAGSMRTARLDSIPGEVLRAQSGPCRTRGHFLRFRPAPFFVAAALLNVVIEPALNLPELDLSVSVAVLQLERSCLVLQHEWCPRERLEFDKFPNPSTFAFRKMNFMSEVCSCSCHPLHAMIWIREIDSAKPVEDLSTSESFLGHHLPKF